MSIQTMAAVWKGSQHIGSALLMMLAIADFADDKGVAYPAVSTLAEKTRMKPRNANYLLSELQASGELAIKIAEGPRGTNLYRIAISRLQGVQPAAGVHRSAGVQQGAGVQAVAGLHHSAGGAALECSKPLHPSAPEPSLNHQEPSKKARKRATPSGLTFTEWYTEAKQQDKVFEPTDAVYSYQQKVGLPIEFVRLGWVVFMAMHKTSDKRQADWKATFRNYIKNGWLRLWYADNASGQFALTTAGVQAAREHDRTELVGSA